MTNVLYLAWRYLLHHRYKTAILVLSVMLIVYVPVGLDVLVDQSEAELTSRAEATPLVIGAKGSPLELVLNTLYFESDSPERILYDQVGRTADTNLALPIPLYVRFHSRDDPIVGTTLDYFEFRKLRVAAGRHMAMLGECVVGALVAQRRGVGPGDSLVSSPESVFDIAGVYPLKMDVVGVLEPSDSPDDRAIFVDIKTAWIIEGLGHGHQDLADPSAVSGVLKKEGSRITANASVMQFSEITTENLASFHFHGDYNQFPITAIIAVPNDEKSGVILRGRYQAGGDITQIVRPVTVMEQLLATILTVQKFVIAAMFVVGVATLLAVSLVFMLSLRLRRREIETMFKIGGSRLAIRSVMATEIVLVLVISIVLAGGLTLLTSRFASEAIRILFL